MCDLNVKQSVGGLSPSRVLCVHELASHNIVQCTRIFGFVAPNHEHGGWCFFTCNCQGIRSFAHDTNKTCQKIRVSDDERDKCPQCLTGFV